MAGILLLLPVQLGVEPLLLLGGFQVRVLLSQLAEELSKPATGFQVLW
jgi:hypothetical protein